MMLATTNNPKLAPWMATINELTATKKGLADALERLAFWRAMWERVLEDNDQLRAELEQTKRELYKEMCDAAEARQDNRYMYARLVRMRAL